jgi:peroxiredoxin Q/BCP
MNEYKSKNAEILGISFDKTEDSARFAEKYKFPFPLLCDTDRKVGLAYGAANSPKDEYARRIAYVIDENGRIAQVHEKVDPKTFPKEQLASL